MLHLKLTHVSLQYYNVVKAPWGTPLLRDLYKKPVVNDEINYEGDIESRWGQLTGEEMTFRFQVPGAAQPVLVKVHRSLFQSWQVEESAPPAP